MKVYVFAIINVLHFVYTQGVSALQVLNAQHREVVNSLQPLYSVFVDTLEFRDLAYETITSIASSQVHLDIVSMHVCVCVCTHVHLFMYILISITTFFLLFSRSTTHSHMLCWIWWCSMLLS